MKTLVINGFEFKENDYTNAIEHLEAFYGYSGIGWNLVIATNDLEELAYFLNNDGVHAEILNDKNIETKKAITISEEEYESLLDDREMLHCLQACGVDNWQGYDDAMQMMNEDE